MLKISNFHNKYILDIIHDDYIPIMIRVTPNPIQLSKDDVCYYRYMKNNAFLEVGAVKNSGDIFNITTTNITSFKKLNSIYEIINECNNIIEGCPIMDFENINKEYTNDINEEYKLYYDKNSVLIAIRDNEIMKSFKCGRILFNIDINSILVSVIITEITDDEHKYIVRHHKYFNSY